MKPDASKITINDNKKKIREFLIDMLINPRVLGHKWSKITNQTPNLKIGYPGQHLASLILGMKGEATGARGNDICDGTEIKSCSKIDQSDKCKKCGENVLRSQNECLCGSKDIKRNNDSKWLITVRSENELKKLTEQTPRFLFIVTDYPYFKENNFDDIRIRAFEVYPQEKRGEKFRELLESYYKNLYLSHIAHDPERTPAPKNLFPDMFPFFMCNPVKVFQCDINDSLSNEPKIKISCYIEPETDRTDIESEPMPWELLKQERKILQKLGINNRPITEKDRELLDLRDTDKEIKIIK